MIQGNTRGSPLLYLNTLYPTNPTYSYIMSTGDLSTDALLDIETIISDAFANFTKFSPLNHGDWDGVRVQLGRLLAAADSGERWDSKQLRQSCRCGLSRMSIQVHIKLENSSQLSEDQKNLLLAYHVRAYEITVIRQMARDLTGEANDDLHANIPTFVRILQSASVSEKIAFRGCERQDEDFCERRKWLAALLKTYEELMESGSWSELDEEMAKIQKSSAQLERLADETFSPFKTLEADPEGSFDSTNPPGSTSPSGPSLTLFFPGYTGSGHDNTANSANTRENMKNSISGASV
jgi:hypothetical protein